MTGALMRISAAELLAAVGCEAIADVEGPDGLLPVNGRWLMDRQEWNLYRALEQAEAQRRAQARHVIEREGCEV